MKSRQPWGFSLGEMLVTVVIGAMVLTAILSVYSRANQAAEAVLQRVESPSLASEVLQLIAEDLGGVLGTDDVTVQIRNGSDNRFARADLVLRRVFHDKDNKEQVLEEITWRAAYDQEGDSPGLILYRSREGMGQEDKLLEDQRADWEKSRTFVPICRGVTFFRIQAYKGEELLDEWPVSAPPAGVLVTISFAEPFETVRGALDVLDEQKVSRTLVINAMRKIKFATGSSGDANEPNDPNQQNVNEDASKERESAEEQDSSEKTPTERITPTRSTRGSATPTRGSATSTRGSTSNERTSGRTKR
ncbi:MAG: hypothetical protein ACM3VT_17030 [Solirubrobacterales bacterium]